MGSHLTIGLADADAQAEAPGDAGSGARPILTALLVGLLVVPSAVLLYRHNGASVPKSVEHGGLAFSGAAPCLADPFPITFCVNAAI